MRSRKTYIDSGVLISAFRGIDEIAVRALEILDDPDREFVSSEFVKLEILPKAIYERNQSEVDFYETFFGKVAYWAKPLEEVANEGLQQANLYGLSALDALHVAAALISGADDIVTTEKVTKPMYRVTSIQVISIAQIS